MSPNPDKKKDYITHKLLWERTGFKDPYLIKDQEEFAKCDHDCPDKVHKNHGSAKSYCELELFHKPVDPLATTSTGIGYISLDGHQFGCDNPNTKEATFHIIFTLDRSGSMALYDRGPLETLRSDIFDKIEDRHNNRLGAVYSAVII